MNDLKWDIPKTAKHPARTIRRDSSITTAKVLAAVLAVFKDEEEVSKETVTATGRGATAVQAARKVAMTLTSVLRGADWDDLNLQYGREGTGARQAVAKVWRDLGGDSTLREQIHRVLDELKLHGNGRASAPSSDAKRPARSKRVVTPAVPPAEAGNVVAPPPHLSPAGFAAVEQMAYSALGDFNATFTAAFKGSPDVTVDQLEGKMAALMVLLRGVRAMAPAPDSATPPVTSKRRRAAT